MSNGTNSAEGAEGAEGEEGEEGAEGAEGIEGAECALSSKWSVRCIEVLTYPTQFFMILFALLFAPPSLNFAHRGNIQLVSPSSGPANPSLVIK